MSNNIAISDDVYERLKRETGDRSFSGVIADHLDSGGTLADVAGATVFDPAAIGAAHDEIDTLSEGTLAPPGHPSESRMNVCDTAVIVDIDRGGIDD